MVSPLWEKRAAGGGTGPSDRPHANWMSPHDRCLLVPHSPRVLPSCLRGTDSPRGTTRTVAVGEASPLMSEPAGKTICLEERAYPTDHSALCQPLRDLRE